MIIVPEVHEALARAVAARARRRPWWRRTPRGVVLGVGVAAATGTALAASGVLGPWRPELGNGDRARPTIAVASVPASQRAVLAVLRRPQTEADRAPGVRRVLRTLGRREIDGIHTDAIRVLRRDADGLTVLVPVDRAGPARPPGPAAPLRHVLCLMRSGHAGPKVIGRRDGKPVLGTGGYSVGSTCGDLELLRTAGLRFSVPGPDGYTSVGLVPDGVARVVLRLRGHRYVGGPVRDNLYEVATGDEIAPGWGAVWLDADGRRIDHRRKR